MRHGCWERSEALREGGRYGRTRKIGRWVRLQCRTSIMHVCPTQHTFMHYFNNTNAEMMIFETILCLITTCKKALTKVHS